MIYVVHYIVNTPIAARHYGTTTDQAINESTLDALRATLAADASAKSGTVVSPADVVIAGFFPIPSVEPTPARQIGGA
jgi:hypothetical protein